MPSHCKDLQSNPLTTLQFQELFADMFTVRTFFDHQARETMPLMAVSRCVELEVKLRSGIVLSSVTDMWVLNKGRTGVL